MPLSRRFRVTTELEVVGLANDLEYEQSGLLDGTRASGTLVSLGIGPSLNLLQRRRFDLDLEFLVSFTSTGADGNLFKTTATAPALPNATYDANAAMRWTGRLSAFYWLFGFESGKKPNAVGIFSSVAFDSHWLSVEAYRATETGSVILIGPETGFYNELAVQLGVALVGGI